MQVPHIVIQKRRHDTKVYRQIRCFSCDNAWRGTIRQAPGLEKKGNRMSYRIVMASLTAAIVGIACLSDAFARPGGGRAGGAHAAGVRAGGVHAGGVRAGGAYRGGAYRGTAYRGAYVRRGVGVGVGAAAVGAAVAAPYYGGSACGYPPYPPCY